jgi:O-antigen/teichoic acid export membrane protein
MKNRILDIYRSLYASNLVRNSFWGVLSSLFQNLFLSIFFVILARQYSKSIFADFLIASTMYQLVVAFSSMGLGQWFMREYFGTEAKAAFVNKFFKIQLILGITFYIVNVVLVVMVYAEPQVRILGIVLGLNIVFDNIIYALTRLNIADSKQKRTAIIILIDSILKLTIGVLLILFPFSIIYLAVLIILIRFITLNLFLRLGADKANLTISSCWNTPIVLHDIKSIIFSNWKFVVVGCVYIINWRFANILISKLLSAQSVADYEIAFKIFSIALMLPNIGAATVYIHFIKYFNSGDVSSLKFFYNTIFWMYSAFSMICCAFVFAFGDYFIPLIFGSGYEDAVMCVKLMFLTMLFSTTASLQANLIVAMKVEKKDMLYNIINMCLNLLLCIVGLNLFKSVFAVNYSILAATILFHLMQDILLINRNIATVKNKMMFYLACVFFVFTYQFALAHFNIILVFFMYSGFGASICVYLVFRYKKHRKASYIGRNEIADTDAAIAS